MAIACPLSSCDEKAKDNKSNATILSISGTWRLISAINVEGRDSTLTDYTDKQETIKIINDSHFSFLRHDLSKGIDSPADFVAGGGKYLLKGNTYTEYLDYCNYREWEGNKFEFEVALSGDTLVQTCREQVEEIGVDRIITETYLRAEE